MVLGLTGFVDQLGEEFIGEGCLGGDVASAVERVVAGVAPGEGVRNSVWLREEDHKPTCRTERGTPLLPTPD